MKPQKITMGQNGRLHVPDHPIVPFIEGDGIGPDVWRASKMIIDAAVAHVYGDKRQIMWQEILAGEKAFNQTGEWLPAATLDIARDNLVSIKGPLTTPVGGGIRSLNVALRQELDLYVCLRPVKWYKGVPSPVGAPENVNMVIFRENTEDIYAGIEFASGSEEASKLLTFLTDGKGNELLRFIGVLAAGHQADVGRHHGGHVGVDELDRKAAVLAGQAEEIDHQANAELTIVDAIGHAEAALGDGGAVARDLQHLVPALVPAFALQHGLHRQVGGTRA